MSRADEEQMREEYRREYLGKGVRGRYHEAYHRSMALVLLDADVAAAFPTEQAVNEALRALAREREETRSD